MKRRILVVDDEEHIVNIMRFTLEHAGYEVIAAHDGKEGLRMAREEKPDLIVLDLMLPNIDGYKVCRLLKFDKKYQQIPIILASARSEAQDRELGRQVGADYFLAKPFQADDLTTKVREFLSASSEIVRDS